MAITVHSAPGSCSSEDELVHSCHPANLASSSSSQTLTGQSKWCVNSSVRTVKGANLLGRGRVMKALADAMSDSHGEDMFEHKPLLPAG